MMVLIIDTADWILIKDAVKHPKYYMMAYTEEQKVSICNKLDTAFQTQCFLPTEVPHVNETPTSSSR